MKKLTFLLLILLGITTNILAQSSQKTSQSTPNTSNSNVSSSVPDSSSNQLAQELKDSKAKITRLENEIFWLALLAALGFILPLPLGFYHIYRMRELAATQASDLEVKIKEQTNKTAQIETLISRNTVLETEIKQMQEKFRTTMKNTQEKHQEAIEKMKNDMHLIELENKRISGVLMLKEQVAKKSSPGN